jgi:hypothetical protein
MTTEENCSEEEKFFRVFQNYFRAKILMSGTMILTSAASKETLPGVNVIKHYLFVTDDEAK